MASSGGVLGVEDFETVEGGKGAEAIEIGFGELEEAVSATGMSD